MLMGRNGFAWAIGGDQWGVGEVVEIIYCARSCSNRQLADTGIPRPQVAFINSLRSRAISSTSSTTGQWLWMNRDHGASNEDPYPIIESIQKMVAEET